MPCAACALEGEGIRHARVVCGRVGRGASRRSLQLVQLALIPAVAPCACGIEVCVCVCARVCVREHASVCVHHTVVEALVAMALA